MIAIDAVTIYRYSYNYFLCVCVFVQVTIYLSFYSIQLNDNSIKTDKNSLKQINSTS